ncbi:MAG: VWA domain-containing protein [Candidatus Acidiferrales bacterium]
MATHLVQVHVIVQSKKGEPVTGLMKEDFTLLDQGQPQKIAFFSEQSGALQPASAQPLPPDTFSNRYEQTGRAPGSVTVILLDGLNTAFTDQSYARQSVVKVLRRLNPEDHVALYVLGTKLTVIQDFTQDSAALLRALDRYEGQFSMAKAASSPEPSQSRDPLEDPNVLRNRDKANSYVAGAYIAQRAQLTSQAIMAIANHLASVPGRKNLVWLSHSYPISVDWAIRALNQADMAIYPVDPCGLAMASLPATPMEERDLGCSIPPEFETMDGLADRTGGRASYNNNDVAGSVRTAIDDGRVSYLLGYYPDHGKWNGQFHEISVKVDRPDVEVRSRKGYFASPDSSPGGKELHAAIEDALVSPLDSTGLGLSISVQPGPQEGQAIFWMNLDATKIHWDNDAGRWRDGLRIVFRQLDAKGNPINSVEAHLTLNLEKATYDRVMSEGIKLARHVAIAPGADTLKVLVLDTASGATGTVTVPVKNYAQLVPEGTGASPGAPPATEPTH